MIAFPLLLAVNAVVVGAAICTARQRIAAGEYITAAFNEPDLIKSYEAINGMPLTRDCPAFVSVNGLPGIEVGAEANSTYAFSNVARQAFTHVESEYHDYGNGTTLMDAVVTLGALRVPVPVYARIMVPIEFDPESCLIKKLPAFVFVPVDVAGNPVDPPIIPSIPGLSTIPPRGPLADLIERLARQGVRAGETSPTGSKGLVPALTGLLGL